MRARSSLGLLLALGMSASMWFYFQRVLVPHQMADAAMHGGPRGNFSDLYPRWWGAHELLLHGRDPYSPEITREIQQGYYGRVLDPTRPDEPRDEQRFAYPVYVVFLLEPSIYFSFLSVQRGFILLLFGGTAASLRLWSFAVGWRPVRRWMIAVMVLLLGSLPFVQGIKLQQLTLLVAVLLAGCLAAIVAGRLSLAGVLLALATIKPQLTWLPVGWLLLWTMYDWRRRQKLARSFLLTMGFLLGAAQWVAPGWLWRFGAGLQAYRGYTPGSMLAILFAPAGGRIAAILLVLLLVYFCRPLLIADQATPAFSASLAAVFALDVVVAPMVPPYDQVLLLPALLALWQGRTLWMRNGTLRTIAALTALLLFWPWIASVSLWMASLGLSPARVQSGWKLPFMASLILPMLVLVLALVYAARLRPARA